MILGTIQRASNASPSARRVRLCLTALATATFLAAPGSVQANGAAARAAIERTTSDVLAALADTSLDAEQKRQRVEAIVFASVDFETVARLVLARGWRRFSAAQQMEFITEFKSHLSHTYSRNIDNYSNQRVDIASDRAEARGDWTVRTRVIRTGADPILVDYRLRARDDAWKIIDIIVEGVSLVANFRSQFQEILANHDPAHLLKLLRDKNITSQPIAG